MKSKNPKKTTKIKMNLFQEVCPKPKSAEMAVLVLVCVVVFGISFFGSGKLLYDYGQKKVKSVLGGKPEIQIMNSAVAAGNQTNENALPAEQAGSSRKIEDKNAEFVEVDLIRDKANKDQVNKEVKAKIIARQRAAELAQINNAPVLAGRTTMLPDGKRTCALKHPQPSGRGGKSHIDEDCCADYDEYPNPRCEYSPAQMAALKKQ